jgi:hypothetical protein
MVRLPVKFSGSITLVLYDIELRFNAIDTTVAEPEDSA